MSEPVPDDVRRFAGRVADFLERVNELAPERPSAFRRLVEDHVGADPRARRAETELLLDEQAQLRDVLSGGEPLWPGDVVDGRIEP